MHDISLREKIGQMLIMGFDGKTVNESSSVVHEIDNENIGGVILFDYNFQTKSFDKNIESPQQVRCLNQDLQRFNEMANRKHKRPSSPLFISVDYEGGHVNRLKEKYGFPLTQSAADVAKMSLEDAGRIAQGMAETLKSVGFNVNFVPMMDVNVNPNNPIVGQLARSFSEDPNVVADYAAVYARELRQAGIQCVYKHFPGHGSSTSDSHLGFVDVTETWQDDELTPYRRLLNTDHAFGMVMTAHIINRRLDAEGLPATLSRPMLTGLLREQLKYDGVIISDDMQMKAISEHYGLEQALTMAINAGVDMFIFGNQLSDQPQAAKDIIDIIEAQVISGGIASQQIEASYRRIMLLKQLGS